jgi:hypothetical protein
VAYGANGQYFYSSFNGGTPCTTGCSVTRHQERRRTVTTSNNAQVGGPPLLTFG